MPGEGFGMGLGGLGSGGSASSGLAPCRLAPGGSAGLCQLGGLDQVDVGQCLEIQDGVFLEY